MKLKFTALAFITTAVLVGCGESQDPSPQGEPQTKAAIKTEQPAALEEKKVVPIEASQLEQDIKSLAKDLTYEGDDVPREQLEQEIREIIQAAAKEQ